MIELAQRQAAIRAATTPLPGSVPETNRRPLNIPGRFAGRSLLDALCAWHPHIPRDDWLRKIERGLVRERPAEPVSSDPVTTEPASAEPFAPDPGRADPSPHNGGPLDPARIVRAGERFEYLTPGQVEPAVSPDIRVLHEDDALVVVCKPAPLPMHPCGPFHRNTLQHILNTAWFPERLRAAHRLDAGTSGVIVLTRRPDLARVVQRQFEERQVRKRYLARVTGHPETDTFECTAALTPHPRAGEQRLIDPQGLPSETRFTVLRRLPDGTALLDVEPLTGRTNQIRIHLWHLGLPVCGDPFFLPGGRTRLGRTHDVADPPLCLHAWQIELRHPLTGRPVTFTAPPPEWMPPDANPEVTTEPAGEITTPAAARCTDS